MKQIPLTQGKFSIVDDDDYDFLMQWKWYFLKIGYAARSVKLNGNKSIAYMHREISRMPSGLQTDHINQNKLDNRKENLRSANKGQNMSNVGKRSGDYYSEHKGVTWDKTRSSWASKIGHGNKTINLGRFGSEMEAAIKYNEAALKYHGEFALLNVV